MAEYSEIRAFVKQTVIDNGGTMDTETLLEAVGQRFGITRDEVAALLDPDGDVIPQGGDDG